MPFECVLLPDTVQLKTETLDGTNDINVLDEFPSTGEGVSSKVKRVSNLRKYCCVSGCSSRSNDRDISFHIFPKSKKLNKLWKIKCRLLDNIPSTYTVCSEHFLASDYLAGGCISGRRMLLKNVVPSQNLPVASYTRKKNDVQIEKRAQRLLNRNAKLPNEPADGKPQAPRRDEKVHKAADNSFTCSKPTASPTVSIRTVVQKKYANKSVKIYPNAVNKASTTPSSSTRVNVMDLLNLKTRTTLNAWTGIQTLSLLRKLEERVSILHPNGIDGLSVLECILLCFIRLKTKLSFVCLTSIFHLSASSVSKTFQLMLPCIKKAMDDVGYFSSTIESPDCKCILLRMYGYDEARAIVDGTEGDERNLRCSCSNDTVHSSTKQNENHVTKLNGTDLWSPELADNGILDLR